MIYSTQHHTLIKCWYNVGTTSQTVAQRCANIELLYSVVRGNTRWTNDGFMLDHRLRCWAKIKQASNQYLLEFVEQAWWIPANTIPWANVALMLGHGLRRWTNNKPTLGQSLVLAVLSFDVTSSGQQARKQPTPQSSKTCLVNNRHPYVNPARHAGNTTLSMPGAEPAFLQT